MIRDRDNDNDDPLDEETFASIRAMGRRNRKENAGAPTTEVEKWGEFYRAIFPDCGVQIPTPFYEPKNHGQVSAPELLSRLESSLRSVVPETIWGVVNAIIDREVNQCLDSNANFVIGFGTDAEVSTAEGKASSSVISATLQYPEQSYAAAFGFVDEPEPWTFSGSGFDLAADPVAGVAAA